MGKFKLTKGELKTQRDALKQYQRYLPTLQLKKQQLQLEILKTARILQEREQSLAKKREAVNKWSGLLTDKSVSLTQWALPGQIRTAKRNIAGVDLPVFLGVDFVEADYDLFLMPLWVDRAIEELRQMNELRQEIKVIEESIRILKHELRITTQRVNLFEKIKIPESQEAIRVIKIYIGDQMANAVGRCKAAKRKIEEVFALR